MQVDRIALDREIVRRYGLRAFIPLAWHLVEPSTPYVYNWHIGVVAGATQATYFGDSPQTIINVPPGTGKSRICSVFADAWAWTVDPSYRVLGFSFDDTLLQMQARAFLQIVQSDWYRERWPAVQLKRTTPALDLIETTEGGLRYSSSIRGRGTGWHGNLIRVDDPIKPADTMSTKAATKADMNYVNEVWWGGTIPTRWKPGVERRYLIIMQRLAENDLAGHVERREHPRVVRLPMKYDPAISTSEDIRTVKDELLWPAMFDARKVETMRIALGMYSFAQLQQLPTNPEGELFKAHQLQRWTSLPRLSSQIISVDAAFKDTAGSDRVAIGHFGRAKTDMYLDDVICDRLGFHATVNAIEAMLARHPDTIAILVEDKANGPAIIETLKKKHSMVIAVTPEGGKVARANAVTPLFEARSVYIPEDGYANWVADYVAEMLRFNGRPGNLDDQVDMTTQALNYLHRHAANIWAAVEAYEST